MTAFSYRAINEDNNEVRGSVDATSLDAAKQALEEQHLEILEVSEASRNANPAPSAVPPQKQSFAYEGTDSAGVVRQGALQATTKREAFDRLKQEQKLMVTMLSPIGVTPEYNDYDLKNWQRKEEAPPAPPPSPLKPVGFTMPDGPKQLPAVSAPRRYEPLLATLRLYAGWLLAWYALFVALGYYVTVRAVPWEIPFVQAFFLSPLVFTFIVATFLFLLAGGIHRALKGGLITGILLSVIGIAAFVGIRMNI